MADWYYGKEGQQLGPVNTATLKQMAADGTLSPSDMIWRDGMAQWVNASQAKGLFATSGASAPPRMVAPALPTTAAPRTNVIAAPPRVAPPPASRAQSFAPQPVAPQTFVAESFAAEPNALEHLTYASRRPFQNQTAASQRPALGYQQFFIPFVIAAVLMLAVNLGLWMVLYSGAVEAWIDKGSNSIVWVLGGAGAFILLGAAAFTFWLIQVNGLHAGLRALSGGGYAISPGQAVGFSCIPVFDAYWIIYMPYCACGELNRHLESNNLPTISAGAVMACQIGSLLAAVLMPGLTPALYAVSMWRMNGAMRRLARAPVA